jgi:hypothetical protein
MLRIASIASISLLAGVWLFACGEGNGNGGTDDDGASTNVGGAGTGGTGTGMGEGGSGGLVFAGPGGSGSGGEQGCLAEEAEATTSPLDIVVLLDRSGSMAGSLWNGSVSALTSFFQNPGGDDISAAISYFPPPVETAVCQPSSYDPPHVPLTDLANPTALINDMQSQNPGGDYTPTWGGLYGALLYANKLQDQNPTHVVIVVLASDGDPTTCNTNIGTIASLAETAYLYNGVRTFVIAIQGATVANLDQIAAAGQTIQALDVTTDINLFKQKMDEIRAQVLGCEYIIPDPTSGEFDATKVNVKYTPGNGGTPQNIPQAASAEDCGNDPGWYYDNPQSPTKIFFCPATCATVQADGMAKVDFVFGCPTVVK